MTQIASVQEGSQMNTSEMQPGAPSKLTRGEKEKVAAFQPSAPQAAEVRHLPFD